MKIFNPIKKVVLSIILLYSYNMITNQFNLTIPINIYTVSFITLFGPFGFLGIVLFYIINFR